MQLAAPTPRLVDAWQPSERRRQGLLSTRSYEQSALICPTDMWTYQQTFIEQRRDGRNPFAGKLLRG